MENASAWSALSCLLYYRALGCTIHSELPLPLRAHEHPPPGHETVVVKRHWGAGDLGWKEGHPVARIGDEKAGYEIRRSGASLYYARLSGHRFLTVDGNSREIHISNPSTALAHVAVNLGLALYLVARGNCVLHAAAFRWQNRAHAIVGPSRAGKSTLSTIVCWAGARPITDDTLRVVRGADSVICFGATESIRLRPSATELAELLNQPPSRPTEDGRTLLDLGSSNGAPEALASIWFAHPDPRVLEPDLVAMRPAQTFQRLVEGIRIRGLCERGLMGEQLRNLAWLAQEVPAYEARVPWGPPFKKTWGEALLAKLSLALGPE